MPYKGGGAAVPDLISGRVSMMLETIPNALPLAKSDSKCAPLGQDNERALRGGAGYSDAGAESGLPDFDVSRLDGSVRGGGHSCSSDWDRLNAETRAIANDTHYVDVVHKMATNVATSSPQEFGAFVRDDVARWTKVIAHAGIQRIP